MVKSKWKRSIKAERDRQQTRLDPGSRRGCTPPMRIISGYTLDPTARYFCPFCLHIDRYTAFLISTSKGYHRGMGQCPECKNKMKLKTLLQEMTPEEYAEFAYPYAASGFWQKVPFEKWRKRLYEMGWAPRFWGRYKELKGEDQEESYDRWLERKQRELMNDT